MQVESVEILIDFTRTVGLATTIAGATILIGSIFLSPYQQVTAIKISGLSIGSGLLLTGAALYEKRKLEEAFFEESKRLAQAYRELVQYKPEPVENKYAKCHLGYVLLSVF